MENNQSDVSQTKRRVGILVDITDLQPGSEQFDASVESLSAEVSVSTSTSSSSSRMQRRAKAADELNRNLLFGESECPEDLGDDWSYISDKNASKRTEHPTSAIDTFVHLIKGNIGTGLLVLPLATKDGGYIVGPIGILILGAIAAHCMIMLVKSAGQLCHKHRIEALDYSETMQFAMKERGAKPVIAKTAKYMVNAFLMITQFGFCSVYFVFMGKTLQQVMTDIFCIGMGDENFDKFWIAVMIIPVVVFSWIRNLDNLASMSILANIFTIISLVVIFYDEIYRFATNNAAVNKPENLQPFGNVEGVALFFGTVIFSFEGIGMVLPLENKMKNPKNISYVIYSAMTCIVSLYASFSIIGYLVYGNNLQSSVTLNLCARDPITAFFFVLAKLLYGVAIFTSFLLQFYVPMDFIEPPLYAKLKLDYLTYKFPKFHGVIQTTIKLGFRTILVLFTAILSIAIPDLGDMITLIGAVASSALALIFPSLIHILTFWNTNTTKYCPRPLWVSKDIAIILLGIVGLLLGTYASIANIVKFFEEKDNSSACPDLEYATDCHLKPPYSPYW